MSKMAEICLIAAKIGCYTNLRVRILTNHTIFCNFRTRQIRWNTSFNDLQTLKISFCKGPPLQIWLIMTSSRCGKTRQSNFLVLPKIESQDLKDHFKKGFSHAYFQKSKTSFWHGVYYIPACNRRPRNKIPLYFPLLKWYSLSTAGNKVNFIDRSLLYCPLKKNNVIKKNKIRY